MLSLIMLCIKETYRNSPFLAYCLNKTLHNSDPSVHNQQAADVSDETLPSEGVWNASV